MLSLVLFAAACEHEPPPKKSTTAQPTPAPGAPSNAAATPPANTPPANTPPGPPGPPPGATVDAGVAAPPDAPPEPTQPCLDMGTHLADVMLSEAKDPAQKAALEQDKTKIVRRAAEACTRDKWKPETLQCFAKATTTEQMQVCARDLAPPPPDRPAGP